MISRTYDSGGREQALRRQRRLARKRRNRQKTHKKVLSTTFTPSGFFPVQFPIGNVKVATSLAPFPKPKPTPNPPGTRSQPVLATGGRQLYTSGFHPSSHALLSGKFGSRFAPAETSTPAQANQRVMETLFTQNTPPSSAQQLAGQPLTNNFMQTNGSSVQTFVEPPSPPTSPKKDDHVVKELQEQPLTNNFMQTCGSSVQTFVEPPPPLSPKKNDKVVKELQEQVKNLDQTVQKNTLLVNRFEEQQRNDKVRLINFQQVVDRLQQESKSLHEKLAEISLDVQRLSEVPKSGPLPLESRKWFFGTPIHEQFLYKAPRLDSVTTEFISEKEQVLLLYPLITDEDDNVWITARRLFDNGTVEDYFTPFYRSSHKALTFKNLTFSSVSCTSD